jgi:hypothetical protein
MCTVEPAAKSDPTPIQRWRESSSPNERATARTRASTELKTVFAGERARRKSEAPIQALLFARCFVIETTHVGCPETKIGVNGLLKSIGRSRL